MQDKELKAFQYIRNQLVHSNNAPSVRDVMRQLGLNSPRSAALIIEKLIEQGYVRRKDDKRLQVIRDSILETESVTTVSIPLVGYVAAGTPILADQNIEAFIPVDERFIKGSRLDYYLLRVVGNSMNKRGITNGDFALIRKTDHAQPGQNIVALIDDEATIKEFVPTDGAVILRPHSTDSSIKPIILHEDFTVQGVVVTSIPSDYL